MHTTPLSLLERLQGEHLATDWVRFAELYTPLLLYWGRHLGLQDDDAADLAQEVLTRAWQQIASYRRRQGKRFRAWLWTIARNRWRERGRRLTPDVGFDDNGWPDPADAVAELVDGEYNAYLVNRALQLMQAEFEPSTWKACWEFVVGGRSAGEVAAELGITANAVYLAKSRVLRRLRQELAGLLE